MEPEGSLPHSHVPANCPYPEPDQSRPCPPIPPLKLESHTKCNKICKEAMKAKIVKCVNSQHPLPVAKRN